MFYTKDTILKILSEQAEETFRVFSAGLMGKEVKMLGVRLPFLRKLSKKIAKTDGFLYLDETELSVKDSYMEEIMLYGMVIGLMQTDINVLFPYIDAYVDLIDNWSTCDSFCAGLKQTNLQKEEMWEYLQKYLTSGKEYSVRFAVVMCINYYITPEYVDTLLKIFDEIQQEAYYVKMAVAWALSICFVKFWDKTVAYMEWEENHLDDFTYKKALQKGRESYCLTAEQKQYLKELKGKRV